MPSTLTRSAMSCSPVTQTICMLASNSSPALVYILVDTSIPKELDCPPTSCADLHPTSIVWFYFGVCFSHQIPAKRKKQPTRFCSRSMLSFTLCLSHNAVSFVSYMPCINLSPKHCLIEGIFFDWGFVCASALSPATCTLTHVDANRCSSHCHTLRASLRLTRLTSPT